MTHPGYSSVVLPTPAPELLPLPQASLKRSPELQQYPELQQSLAKSSVPPEVQQTPVLQQPSAQSPEHSIQQLSPLSELQQSSEAMLLRLSSKLMLQSSPFPAPAELQQSFVPVLQQTPALPPEGFRPCQQSPAPSVPTVCILGLSLFPSVIGTLVVETKA